MATAHSKESNAIQAQPKSQDAKRDLRPWPNDPNFLYSSIGTAAVFKEVPQNSDAPWGLAAQQTSNQERKHSQTLSSTPATITTSSKAKHAGDTLHASSSTTNSHLWSKNMRLPGGHWQDNNTWPYHLPERQFNQESQASTTSPGTATHATSHAPGRESPAQPNPHSGEEHIRSMWSLAAPHAQPQPSSTPHLHAPWGKRHRYTAAWTWSGAQSPLAEPLFAEPSFAEPSLVTEPLFAEGSLELTGAELSFVEPLTAPRGAPPGANTHVPSLAFH